MKTNIMHRISSNNFISYHPYLESYKLLIEDIQIFVMNMTFISSSEVKK